MYLFFSTGANENNSKRQRFELFEKINNNDNRFAIRGRYANKNSVRVMTPIYSLKSLCSGRVAKMEIVKLSADRTRRENTRSRETKM